MGIIDWLKNRTGTTDPGSPRHHHSLGGSNRLASAGVGELSRCTALPVMQQPYNSQTT